MELQEIRTKRAGLVTQARAILDAATAAKRDLSAEEQTQYENLMGEVDTLGTQIAREERTQLAERELNRLQTEGTRPEPGAPVTAPGNEARRAAFRKYLAEGERALSAIEARDLQADLGAQGGFLVPPMEFVNELIIWINNQVFMRQFARKFTLEKSDSMGAPSLADDPSAPNWTGELSPASIDSTMDFGRRELHPHPLTKAIKISNKLLRLSAIPVEQLIIERLGYVFSIAQENGFLTGNGSNQPLGVFTASPLGISTNRDVSTGNTTTAVTFDGLMEAKYSIKGQYWPGLRWIFNRTVLKSIRKLKDGDGQYLWQASVTAGQPDMLLGSPVAMSEYAPNTMTTGQYVGILGDFRYYWIVDAMDFGIQRLTELFALSNQVGLIARAACDGAPVLEEAWARVKLA